MREEREESAQLSTLMNMHDTQIYRVESTLEGREGSQGRREAGLPAARRNFVALEVGAGTGSTASSVLPLIRDLCARYFFTDVSEVFLLKAQARFSEYAFVEYALLNVDAEPRIQGFASHEHHLLVSQIRRRQQ